MKAPVRGRKKEEQNDRARRAQGRKVEEKGNARKNRRERRRNGGRNARWSLSHDSQRDLRALSLKVMRAYLFFLPCPFLFILSCSRNNLSDRVRLHRETARGRVANTASHDFRNRASWVVESEFDSSKRSRRFRALPSQAAGRIEPVISGREARGYRCTRSSVPPAPRCAVLLPPTIADEEIRHRRAEGARARARALS